MRWRPLRFTTCKVVTGPAPSSAVVRLSSTNAIWLAPAARMRAVRSSKVLAGWRSETMLL